MTTTQEAISGTYVKRKFECANDFSLGRLEDGDRLDGIICRLDENSHDGGNLTVPQYIPALGSRSRCSNSWE